MSFAYLPLYTGDYLRDTQHLSCCEHGIYLKLLMHCWDQKGPAPIDERKLCGIVNARSSDEIEAMRSVLAEFFTRMEDGHYNHRMQSEIERSEAISGARSEAGKKGFQAKAKHLLSKSQARAKQVPLSPSPSLSLEPSLSASLPQNPENPIAPSALSGKPARKRASKPTAQTGDVWAAYAQAYKERYQVEPVRNAKVNGQLAQLIARLGADESPGVARAYLDNRNGLYVASKHCVDLLLRDAEKLRTEWATGNVTHRGDAAQADRLGSVGNQAARVTAILNNMGPK